MGSFVNGLIEFDIRSLGLQELMVSVVALDGDVGCRGFFTFGCRYL